MFIENFNDFKNLIDGVREGKNGKWRGKCPAKAHSKQETDNGQKISFNCYASCTGEEILQSLGLEWNDIYLARTWSKWKGFC